jgi:NTE family protein
LRVGLENGDSTATPALSEQTFPTVHQHIGAMHVRLDLDTLDRWAFPSEGHYLHADFKNSRELLGANTNYSRGDLQLEQAFHYGDQDVILGLSGGSGFGTQLPVQDLFPLGGFLQLSGYQQREFLGQSYVLGRLITYHSLGDPGALTRRLFVGGSLEAGNVYERFNGSNDAGLRHSGSLFLGADTGIGPLFVGVGVAGNSRSAYLFLGRP